MIRRVSYNGYYVTFPRLRQEFDSPYPHHARRCYYAYMPLRSRITREFRRWEKPFDTYNEITISRSALLHNFDYFASLSPSGYVIPVLKSNAYGHGIREVAAILKARTFPYIAVDGYYERLAIQEVSDQPVLVMGAIKPANFERMSFKGAAFVVQDVATVRALGKPGRKVNVHIELETGMTRHGVARKDLPAFLRELAKHRNIRVEGVMTHLADADNPADNTYNQEQSNKFDEAVALILKAGFAPRYFHIAQSAGSTKITSEYANAMRIGIALYGVNPLEPGDPSYRRIAALSPVLKLSSTISKIQEVEAGTTVSYGRTYKAAKRTRLGVLPLGYYEGLPRDLSNAGSVQFGSMYLKIAGRVCMNHTMIDLGNSKAVAGDTVTVISNDKKSKLTVDRICRQHGLFNYGFLVGLNENIRRRIVA